MESKEIFPEKTFVERHVEVLYWVVIPVLVFISGALITLILSIVSDEIIQAPFWIGVVLSIILMIFIMPSVELNRKDGIRQQVDLFLGDHEYMKFVENSLKYLGYETKIMPGEGQNDASTSPPICGIPYEAKITSGEGQNSDFILLENKHLVYVSKNGLSLKNLEIACEQAKENNKSLTVITDDEYIRHNVYASARRGGIIIHDLDDLYNTLRRAIEDPRWEPIKECLTYADVFDKLEKAPHMKQLMLEYDFPTSNLYPDNRYPKSRSLNYIVENSSMHTPFMDTDKMLLIVTFKPKTGGMFVAVQQNGNDLESNLDIYVLQDNMKLYEDLSRVVLKNHGCSGHITDDPSCIKCADCGKMIAFMGFK